MKVLTAEQRALKLFAASGQLEVWKKRIDWGRVSLLISMAAIGVFVGFVGAFLLLAFIE